VVWALSTLFESPYGAHLVRLWRSLHGSEAQSQHIRRAARVGPRSLQIAKGRLVAALLVRTLLDHFGPQSKIRIARNLNDCVGLGYEPTNGSIFNNLRDAGGYLEAL
jgi:hypothetical protein